ncbi:MAG: T9SS type A sorting domain-containing protein [Saprospiraceae bacterium]|nr:T9SS type A sorting domain-containing protein [Saprospiraceae bacterium]
MKKFANGLSIATLMLLGFTQLSAQNVVWSENFANGIPAGWGNDDAAPSNVLWTYCPDPAAGNANPGCAPIFTGRVAFASETAANGFAVLDSDEGGELTTNHISRLTTPAINMSALSDVFLGFQTQIGTFTVATEGGAILRVSSDNVNWTEYTIFPGLGAEWSANPELPIIDISAAAAGQSTVYIQWQWTGNYEYMWEIDDIKIYDANPTPPNDLELADFFYPVSSFATPASQIATDTFGFYGYVSNNGTAEQTNVTLKAIVRVDGGAVLFSDSIVVPALAAGVKDSLLVLPNQFAPELPEGSYRIQYSLYADATDDRPSDNAGGSPFEVTDFLFSKEGAPEQAFRTGSGGDYTIGNLYTMSTLDLESYQATSITFAYFADAAEIPLADVAAGVNLFRVNDDVDADWANFDDADLFSTSLTNVGFATYEADASSTNFALQTVELYNLNTGEPGVPLDPGARYFATVSWDGPNNVVYHAFNNDISTFFVNSLVYSSQWFLGGFQGDDDNAVVRMGISLVTSTDNNPLADNTMNIFPNPVVNGSVNLDLSFAQPTDATITIADMSGRVISVRDRMGVTEEKVNFNLPQLATGTYIARIATKEGTLTKKFVVQQ